MSSFRFIPALAFILAQARGQAAERVRRAEEGRLVWCGRRQQQQRLVLKSSSMLH